MTLMKKIEYTITDVLNKWKLSIADRFGNPLIYDYQKTLLKLTIVLVGAILVVIRGSTAPVLVDNKMFRLLFCSEPTGDKTFYNICVSIIAAYIFYVVQVYIPEKHKMKKYISIFSKEHRYEIFLLNQYLLAWEKFIDKEEGKCYFCEFSYELNHKINGAVTESTYEETIEALTENIERIMTHKYFDECDIAYKDFIVRTYQVVRGHLKYMDDKFPRWSEEPLYAKDYRLIYKVVFDDLRRIQRRLETMEKYKLRLIKTSPYGGKSETQKLAALL